MGMNLNEWVVHAKKHDGSFVQDLKESQKAVVLTATTIQALLPGAAVHVPDMEIRPDERFVGQYADDGDLFVNGHRIEVKQRRLMFTGPEDFPYDTITVDVQHTWDRAVKTGKVPVAYVFWNKDLTASMLILGKTSGEWKRVSKIDRFKKRQRHFLDAPMSSVSVGWEPLLCILRERVTGPAVAEQAVAKPGAGDDEWGNLVAMVDR